MSTRRSAFRSRTVSGNLLFHHLLPAGWRVMTWVFLVQWTRKNQDTQTSNRRVGRTGLMADSPGLVDRYSKYLTAF